MLKSKKGKYHADDVAAYIIQLQHSRFHSITMNQLKLYLSYINKHYPVIYGKLVIIKEMNKGLDQADLINPSGNFNDLFYGENQTIMPRLINQAILEAERESEKKHQNLLKIRYIFIEYIDVIGILAFICFIGILFFLGFQWIDSLEPVVSSESTSINLVKSVENIIIVSMIMIAILSSIACLTIIFRKIIDKEDS